MQFYNRHWLSQRWQFNVSSFQGNQPADSALTRAFNKQIVAYVLYLVLIANLSSFLSNVWQTNKKTNIFLQKKKFRIFFIESSKQHPFVTLQMSFLSLINLIHLIQHWAKVFGILVFSQKKMGLRQLFISFAVVC